MAVLGLGPLVVRQVASYHSFESWGLLRGMLRRSNQSVALASALTMAVAACVGWLVYRSQPELLHAFWIALLLIPLIAFATLRQAALQGLGRVVLGRAPETIVAPALFIGLAAAAASALGDDFSAGWAVAMQVVATFCALCSAYCCSDATSPRRCDRLPASTRRRLGGEAASRSCSSTSSWLPTRRLERFCWVR